MKAYALYYLWFSILAFQPVTTVAQFSLAKKLCMGGSAGISHGLLRNVVKAYTFQMAPLILTSVAQKVSSLFK